MSLLAPLRPLLRRSPPPPTITVAASQPREWHVGVSFKGMFPFHEASCPCPKAPCGLAVPTTGVFCPVHQGKVLDYRQIHVATECGFPRTSWFRRARR